MSELNYKEKWDSVKWTLAMALIQSEDSRYKEVMQEVLDLMHHAESEVQND